MLDGLIRHGQQTLGKSRKRFSFRWLAAGWIQFCVISIGCAPSLPLPPPRATYLPPEELTSPLLLVEEYEDGRRSPDTAFWEMAHHPSPLVRAKSARALGRLQEKTGLPALKELAEDADATVRKEAYFAIGQLQVLNTPFDAALQDLLTARFEKETVLELKEMIVHSLGKCGDVRSRAILLSVIKGETPQIRGEAAISVAIQTYRRLAPPPDSEVTAAMVNLLRDPLSANRWKAAYAFNRAPPVVPDRGAARIALQDLLTDSDATVRIMAARALGEVGDGASLTALRAAMQDVEWRVRVNCLRAASKLKGSTALAIAQVGLGDVHPLVRQQAVEALGVIEDPQAVLLLEPLVNDQNEDPAIVAAAVTALGQLQGMAAFDALAPYTRSSSVWVRVAAISTFGRLSDSRSLDLLQNLAGSEEDPRVMAALADALGSADPAKTYPSLVQLMDRGDAAVVTVTAKLIGAHKIEAGLPSLVTAFRRQSPVRDWESREAIVKALGELGLRDDKARDILVEALGDMDARVAKAAAESYRTLFHQEPTPRETPIVRKNADYFEVLRYQRAVIETDKGTIVVGLFPEEAPLTVANFVRLARQGYFDGLSFHRVVPNFVAQTGCPRGDGWGGPGYTIRCEVNPKRYERGSVGMALSGKDTGGSQFFITHSPEPHLDGTYTIFGQVLEGMDTVDQMKRGDIIQKIRVSGDEE